MKRLKWIMGRLLFVGLVSLPLLAEAAPPEMYRPLQRVDFAAKSITFGGNTYRLAKDVRWVGIGKRRPEDVVPLMAGHQTGVVMKVVDGVAVVTQVWIDR